MANSQIPTQLLTPSFLPSFSHRTQGKKRVGKIMGQDKDRGQCLPIAVMGKTDDLR